MQYRQKMSKSQISGPYLKFINKIRQLKSPYYKGQKQKQMQSEQQLLSNEQFFKMSVQLLKENLEMDQIQFQQFESNEKFKAYIRCIESIGLMLSKFYQEQESQLITQIQTLKQKNHEFEQKITNYMELNQSLNEQLDHLQHKQAIIDQQLNKSQHQIQHGKHSILTQINARQLLAHHNQKLNTTNHQLVHQISNLKQIIETLNTQNYESIKKNQQLHLQLSKFRTLYDKIQRQKNDLQAQKKTLQAQINGLNELLEQKDYLLGNKILRQRQSYQNFAQIHERFLSSTVRVVREQNQEANSDKQVMKDIQQACCLQPILPLKFLDSRSISKNSQISLNSIINENIMLDDIQDNYQESPEHIGDRKILKTDRKRKESTGPKQSHNKSCNKMQEKHHQNSVNKILFVNSSPKVTQKTTNEQLITQKKKKVLQSTPKFQINLQRNSSQQNHSKIKHRKLKSNTSLILRNTKSKVYEKQSNIKQGKIQHSQSVEDLYRDDVSQNLQIEGIQREIFNREKMIQNLKLENRSVRQMVLEQSEKRTDAEHEYEQTIERLQSQVQYFKKQMKDNYIKFVEQKALSDSLQNQLYAVSLQVQQKAQEYEKAKNQLKDKCKQYIQNQIAFYQSRYEQIQQKMKNMELSYLNNKKEFDDIEDQLLRQENPKQLKKSKSNSLFYKQVKHHSYNTSQQYSDINHLSANHSKNASFINMDDEQLNQGKLKHNQNILIYDCDENQMQEPDQDIQELRSYQEERQICDIGVQTETTDLQDESSYKISLQYSKMNQVQDSSEISYDFSSLGIRSSEQISKIKGFMSERLEKIKRLGIYHMEDIIIESQKSFISEFDTNAFSPRAKENSCITADHSRLYKMKQNSPLCLQKAFAFTIDQFKSKSDNSTCTQMPLLAIVKNDSVSVKSIKNKASLNISKTVSEDVLPSRKNIQNTEAQHDLTVFSSFQTQTLLADFSAIGITTKGSFSEIQTQTNKKQLKYNEILSMSFLPHKNKVAQFGTHQDNMLQFDKQTQINPLVEEATIQTVTNLTRTPLTIFENITPTTKYQNDGSTQTKKSEIKICRIVLTQTIYPSLKLKNDHNQSVIQEHLNEIISDLSQSLEISDRFIQTLKKKLLQINENLRQLQEQKNHNSSSSSSNGVQNIFNSIEMDVDISKKHINQSLLTIPKFNFDTFEGNVKTSKASTNCSISNSMSFHSPCRHEAEQVKLKVPQFEQILQIESENLDSFMRIKTEHIKTNPYSHSQYEEQVNRTPEQENILVEELKTECFLDLQKVEGGSGKKYQQNTKKLQRLLGSPKNHIIQKQKLSFSLNSLKYKHSKNQLKHKNPKIQKPQQLQSISDQDFYFLCQRFKAKNMKLIQKNQSKSMSIESKNGVDSLMYHYLSSHQLMVVFCKQVSRKNSIQENTEIIIVHESRVLSLTQHYEFEALRVVVSKSGDRMIFGNQEIILTENQLKFLIRNKLNHFNGLFPSKMSVNKIESIEKKEFEVLNMFKYKFR